MLTTGIEVEARPPGKKVKRLSLLSGGERSLTAVAFLVAIFKARPSPFYVMDEVEAALDDVNLQRLLTIMEELREDSQLLVITHQKRTMEIADALYGVSMRGDGVTTVISQRLREDRDEPGTDDHPEKLDVTEAAPPAAPPPGTSTSQADPRPSRCSSVRNSDLIVPRDDQGRSSTAASARRDLRRRRARDRPRAAVRRRDGRMTPWIPRCSTS